MSMADYSYLQETADKCLSCSGSPDLVRKKDGWIIVCNDCNRSTNPTFKLWKCVIEWNQRQRLSYDNY